jgi:hypothetical protein
VDSNIAGQVRVIYESQNRSGGRGAVVRRGIKGGTRLIAVYKSQTIAAHVADLLNSFQYREV